MVRRRLGTGLHQTTAADSDQPVPPTRIVVVGGGIGGLTTAFDATHFLKDHHNVQVTVVSNREDFQFTPSNPWVAIGKRTPEEISLPLAEVLPKYNIDFVYGTVDHLNPKTQELKVRLSQSEEEKAGSQHGRKYLPYDYLVIATGPRLAYDEIPGAKLGRTVHSICTTPHAVTTLVDFRQKFQADDPHPPAVVVAATQGASCFGPAYEFVFMIHHELELLYGKGQAPPVTLVTAEPYLGHLGLGGAGDSQEVVTGLLDKHRIAAWTNSKITRVSHKAVHIEQVRADGIGPDTHVLPSQFTVMIPPFRGQKVWKSVPNLTDEHGMIRINKFQQSVVYPDIFGVGVGVHLAEEVTSARPLDDTPIPIGIPKTGYMIESMGTATIHNIGKLMDAKENDTDTVSVADFEEPTLNGVCITDFGHEGEGAVFVTVPQFATERLYDWTLTGRVATLAKLAFEKYFMYKIEHGDTDPYYEKYLLELVGIGRIAKAPLFRFEKTLIA
jgi:sulfide:quinone oxidoreductase